MGLGGTSMDLSSYYRQLALFFVRPRLDGLLSLAETNRVEATSYFRVFLQAQVPGAINLVGAGRDTSKFRAFFKALGELGEAFLCHRLKRPNRSGLAGGFLFKKSKERAYGEILERDAFFHHYRSGVPFLDSVPDQFRVFLLDSRDPKFKVVLVTDSASIRGELGCLVFGLGTAIDLTEAVKKARYEYLTLRRLHQIRPDRCRKLATLSPERLSMADRHHIASRDQRNLDRFRHLCEGFSDVRRLPIDPAKLSIKRHNSPIFGFKYAEVSHPDLIPMEMGVSEIWTGNLSSHPTPKPLLHPLW